VALSLEADRFQGLNPGKDHPCRLGQGLGQKALLGEDLPYPPSGVHREDPQHLPLRAPQRHPQVGPRLPLPREEDHPRVPRSVRYEKGLPLLQDHPGDPLAPLQAKPLPGGGKPRRGHQFQLVPFRPVKEKEGGGRPGAGLEGLDGPGVDLFPRGQGREEAEGLGQGLEAL